MARFTTPYMPAAVVAAGTAFMRRPIAYPGSPAALEAERAERQAEFDARAVEYEKIRPFRVALARLDQKDAADRSNPMHGFLMDLLAE